MIKRKIEDRIRNFYQKDKKALLITGARQVGKTYIIREFGKTAFESFVEINFLENRTAQTLFENAKSSAEILLRISALTDQRLIPGKTLVFFDEVQECKELVTAIKFLVDEGSYRYILSGSLLGVDLKDIRSAPVGYMDIFEMYPLDFEEFALANGVSDRVIHSLRIAYENRTPVDALVHERMMDLFRLYLIVGGMPSVVARYLETNNLQEVVQEQRAILALYRQDIAKYDPKNKLYLEDIFAQIPSELNAKNKRFILKNLNENFKFSRYQNSFIWLKNAGVALPTFCVTEPTVPLMLNKSANLFKLFLSDVGLLAAMYMDGIQLKLLNREKGINFGSIYENAAAQELKAHGFDLYYFNSKKQGELDFIVEISGDVLPIEMKSGKDYARHAALDNVMGNLDYAIPVAYVFQNDNVKMEGKVVYLPVYMLMFLQKEANDMPQIYKVNLDGLR
ncbi:MAG: ATP-binding protein [Verrucomicrobia bacterium]|nr:ATP-binding protein [Verrucomicrobiota bacterium]